MGEVGMSDGTTTANRTAPSAPPSASFPRHEQTFPALTPQEIERMRRFAEVRKYKDGEKLFETGKPGPGMFVVLSGHVTITQRDGLGHVTPVIDQGPGQFLAELGQLSGRVALVDGRAEGDVETLLIPPPQLRALLVAEADLGERIMRALILRRVSLIQAGAGGPVLIGPPNSSGVVRLRGFLTRNGNPHHLLDPKTDHDAAEVIARYSPSPTDWPLVVAPDGTVLRNPSETELARAMGMIRGVAQDKVYDVAVVGSGPAGLSTAVYAASEGVRCALVRRPGRRQRAHRKLSGLSDRHFRAGADRAGLQPGAKVRRRGDDPGLGEIARLLARGWRLHAQARQRRHVAREIGGDRERRAIPAPRDRKPRRLRGSRCLVLGLADRGAAVRRAGHRSGRRRQFRRAGRGVPVGPRAPGEHGDPRRRARRQHVALFDRADRGDAEHRIDVQRRGGRA
jgi:CRP-like cAMP-binding protein